MPEKPEVITVARSLESKIIGKKITDCKVYWNNIIAMPSVQEFKKEIVDETIQSIKTRGKFIWIELDHYNLLIHLRMEGKFLFREKEDKIEKHEHIEWILDNTISFRYHDVRKFGKMYLISKEETEMVPPIVNLGLEYNDKNLTKDYLYQKIHQKKLPIKTILLDQSIITGIGNIYDDEILFLSNINPLKKGENITKKECEVIIENTKLVLEKAILLGGTTIRSFTSSEGVHGKFQNELLIHGKDKGNCPICKNMIKKIKVGGRGTYYCPQCQKEKE